MTFAVLETGGKQYKVSVGQKLKIEKLNAKKEGEQVIFDKILLIDNKDEIKIGTPYLEKAQVEGKILKQGRNRKVIVFKYHSKTRYKKKKGHRQYFTEIEITKIK